MLISPSQIIKQSWDIFTKHWRLLATYILLLFLPTLVLSALGLLGIALSASVPASSLANSIIILMIFAASLVFSLWTTIALAKLIKNLMDGRPTEPWLTVFKSTSPLIWPIIYTTILVALIVLGGSLLFIIPGIIFTIWYSFTFYAIIFDNQRGLAALRQSKKLVLGRWWAICWRLVVPTVFFALLALFIQNLVMLLLKLLTSWEQLQAVIYGVSSALVNAWLAPLTIAAAIILYFNAKETPVATSTPADLQPPTPPSTL